jgi:signal transduction histidine kinase
LAQILDNYLANALEVAPSGSTIAVHVERNGNHVAVHVVDQGPGLSAEDRARAFDRFWRSSGASPGRGSGLGLAIVRQLAEASGGSAALEAAPGGGTDALVVLPIA